MRRLTFPLTIVCLALILSTAANAQIIGWCNLQWPPTLNAQNNSPSPEIYGQVWIDGVTSAAGAAPGLTAEIGFSDSSTSPATWVNWKSGVFNVNAGNNDEFRETLTFPTPGSYYYAWRYSYNAGPYVYGGLSGPITDTNTNNFGIATVSQAPVNIDWCILQHPSSTSTPSGVASENIYGQVWIDGVTDPAGAAPGLTAELGYSDTGTSPAHWVNWETASFNVNVDNNDEFTTALLISSPGVYRYAFRYSRNGGPYAYGGLNGPITDNNPDNLGTLTVTGQATPTPTPTPTQTVTPTPTATPTPTVTPEPTPTMIVELPLLITPPTLDGTVNDAEYMNGPTSATLAADPAKNTFGPDNDIGTIYLGNDADNLYIGIKGFKLNGQPYAFVLFLDTTAGNAGNAGFGIIGTEMLADYGADSPSAGFANNQEALSVGLNTTVWPGAPGNVHFSSVGVNFTAEFGISITGTSDQSLDGLPEDNGSIGLFGFPHPGSDSQLENFFFMNAEFAGGESQDMEIRIPFTSLQAALDNHPVHNDNPIGPLNAQNKFALIGFILNGDTGDVSDEFIPPQPGITGVTDNNGSNVLFADAGGYIFQLAAPPITPTPTPTPSPTPDGATPTPTPTPSPTPDDATPTPTPTPEPDQEIGWCNLQWPLSTTTSPGTPTESIYGQVWIDGVTDQPGAAAGLTAELGYGPDGTLPDTWNNWTAAAFNVDAGNNDEFFGQLIVGTAGTYRYAYRFSRNGGPYYYGDLDGLTNGIQLEQLGTLIVTDETNFIQSVIDHILGRSVLSTEDFETADANNDDVIDVQDVILLLNDK